ncbi:deoxyribonuclease IV [Candidatus Uhrbacteria bacterium]|nr:deoxyribonuclease IV [Candidatus Uhrbacteria bacterium]
MVTKRVYCVGMFFGAHVSVAGGVQNAPLNAAKIGCEVFQFFSRSPQGGPAPKLTSENVEAFLKSCKELDMREWVIHTPYYINFASGEERTRKNSVRIVREELERGTTLNAKYVMFHPGSAKDVGKDKARKFVIDGIKHIYDKYSGACELLIEISAGAGMVIGDTFEEIAELIEGVGHPKLGVCFDTQHAFASGYDLRTKEAVEETFKKFDKIIGLKKLKMSHCNDSKVELAGHRDRHEHLGEGHIGLKGFDAIVNHPKLKHMNLYLETEHDKVVEDLKKLKKMREGK